jgi:hypothetical protein
MSFERKIEETASPIKKEKKEDIPVIEVEKWLKFSGPSQESNKEFKKFLQEKGIELNSGVQEVWIEGGPVKIFTDEERFGSIVQNDDMIFET